MWFAQLPIRRSLIVCVGSVSVALVSVMSGLGPIHGHRQRSYGPSAYVYDKGQTPPSDTAFP